MDNDESISHYTYAFGNANELTGLGDWPYSNEALKPEKITTSDKNVEILPEAKINSTNFNNRFIPWINSDSSLEEIQNGMSPLSGPNLQGATFGIIQEIQSGINGSWSNSSLTLDWASEIVGPLLFDGSNTTQAGLTYYSSSIPYGPLSTTNYNQYFTLGFNRLGGTYTLDKVYGYEKQPDGKSSKNDSFTTSNLSLIEKVGNYKNIKSNNFWPMDKALSYGANGHDLKFGEATKKADRRPVGEEYLGASNLRTKDSGDGFPPSDDGKDHNSFFGMNTQFFFTLEDGYAAPLRYFFYGDDDMFVFLSKVVRDEDGNVQNLTDTRLIADLGGVHYSIGMYVNLWNFINNDEKELIEIRPGSMTATQIEEDVYQYKVKPSSIQRETGNANLEQDSSSQKSQEFVLSVFYTERGASGSSYYMRFSLPFESMTLGKEAHDGQLKIEKKVENALLTQIDNSVKDKLYIFELKFAETDNSASSDESDEATSSTTADDSISPNISHCDS